MKKSSCWFKLNIPSLLLLPLPLRTTAHTGGCLGLLGLHWSSRSNLFWSSCPGCSFNHLEYTYWSYGMRHITQVLRTYPVAPPARLNECDPWSGGYRLSVLQLAQVMEEGQRSFGGQQLQHHARSPEGLAVHVCSATTSQRLFCFLPLCYHAIAWLPRQSIQSSLTRSLFLLTLPEPIIYYLVFFLLLYLQVSHQKKLPAKFFWCLSLPISSLAHNVYHLQ